MIDPLSLHYCVVALFMAILGLALLSDLESLRIPNRFSIALVLLYPAYAFAGGVPVNWPAALLIALLVFVVGLLPFAAGWMGGGDVKLMAAIALWLGPDAIWPFLATTAVFGGVLALIMVTQLRFVAVHALEKLSWPGAGDLLLGRWIPYGVAISIAGWVIGGPHLLAAGGIR